MKSIEWVLVLSAAIACPLTLGCGGGASETPTVTVKQKSSGDEGSSSSAKSDDSDEAPAEPGTIGNIRGRIVYKGTPPELAPLIPQGAATRDGEVCAADMNIPDQSLVVSGDGGIRNVFVYLDKAPKGVEIPAVPSEPVPFDQKNCVFLPHALLVRVDQPIKVLNDDAVQHNTHTFPTRNAPFNNAIKPNDREGLELVYAKGESQPFEVKCDVHTWMRAYHLALEHPFAAVTGEDGSFEIQGLPAGKHEFRIWHERAKGGYLERKFEVTVKEGDNELPAIEFDGSKFN